MLVAGEIRVGLVGEPREGDRRIGCLSLSAEHILVVEIAGNRGKKWKIGDV